LPAWHPFESVPPEWAAAVLEISANIKLMAIIFLIVIPLLNDIYKSVFSASVEYLSRVSIAYKILRHPFLVHIHKPSYSYCC